MGWVKIDDEFTDHPKIDELSDGAFRLHVASLCYVARKLTDGIVPTSVMRRLVPCYKPALVDELVAAGLWTRVDVDELRVVTAPSWRVTKNTDPRGIIRRAGRRLRSIIAGRDGERCARCGVTTTLEVDHDLPVSRGGTSILSNLRLLCGPCNRAKGTKTWAEWIEATS